VIAAVMQSAAIGASADGSRGVLTPERALELAAEDGGDSIAAGDGSLQWLSGTHKLLYSATNSRGGAAIYALNADTGDAVPLFEGSHPVPSADGKHVAFLRADARPAGIEGKETALQLWVANPDGTGARQLTSVAGGLAADDSRLLDYQWSPDSTRILYRSFTIDEKAQPAATDPIQIATRSTARVYPQGTAADRRDKTALHVIQVGSGNDSAVFESYRYADSFGWLDRETLYYECSDDKPITESRSFVFTRSLKTARETKIIAGYNRQAIHRAVANPAGTFIAFGADPGEAVFHTNRNEIGIYDVRAGTVRILTANARVGSLSWAPDGHSIIYVDGVSTRRNLHLIDTAGKGHVLTRDTGTAARASFSSDGRLASWIQTNPDMKRTIRVAHWNGSVLSRPRDVLTLEEPLEGFNAGTTRAIEWQSSDGLAIDGYLTLPPSYDKSRKYPLVVLVHGGPQGGVSIREGSWPSPGYYPYVLASRNYVVFRPDYRESTMFGFDKMLAAVKAGKVYRSNFADIISGVDYLEQQGIADPAREFLLGHSAGGCQVNWIVAHTTRFRAAISYEGCDELWDWGGPGFMPGPLTGTHWSMGGTPLDEPDVYRENSAIANIKGVTTPTMFINSQYGADPASHRWLYSALQVQGVDTAFVYYADDLHGVTKPENQADLMQRSLQWIYDHDLK
jgi:poly(3-hydroxybutyrate) depolymerase